MEDLKEFHHFKDDASFGLVVGLAVEGSLDVFIDLDSHFFADPTLGSSLQQLNVQGVGHAELVLDADCPYLSPEFFRHELPYQVR